MSETLDGWVTLRVRCGNMTDRHSLDEFYGGDAKRLYLDIVDGALNDLGYLDWETAELISVEVCAPAAGEREKGEGATSGG